MVDLIRRDEFADQRQNQGAIGAGTNRDPFIGNCGIARSDRIDRNKAPT